MKWMNILPLYFIISAFVIVPSVFSLFKNGLKLSVEFTGGSQFTVNISNVSAENLLSSLSEYHPVIVDNQNGDITIKTTDISQEEITSILNNLNQDQSSATLLSFETIGPVLGQETIKKTINALVIATILLLFYISFAFKQLKYGLSAIIAMLHDTLILVGSFSILVKLFNLEVDLLFVTAVLTILSFSVHDTIVVFDRIRELSHKNKNLLFEDLVNQAVSETMTRSLNNSLTIIFMLLAMYLIGGSTTQNFALALLIGTVTGTYSSTFTAAPLLVVWEKYFSKK